MVRICSTCNKPFSIAMICSPLAGGHGILSKAQLKKLGFQSPFTYYQCPYCGQTYVQTSLDHFEPIHRSKLTGVFNETNHQRQEDL